ncbi:hypothetical protein ACKI1O_34445 [Streptomyces scabiei]
MAKVRYIGDEPVTVPELFGHDRYVQPDEIVEVPDARFEGYVCQPNTWEAIEDPGAKAPKKTTAVKTPQKEG